MPNGTYGGVRGTETKVGQKTFVSRPTRLFLYMEKDMAGNCLNIRSVGVLFKASASRMVILWVDALKSVRTAVLGRYTLKYQGVRDAFQSVRVSKSKFIGGRFKKAIVCIVDFFIGCIFALLFDIYGLPTPNSGYLAFL